VGDTGAMAQGTSRRLRATVLADTGRVVTVTRTVLVCTEAVTTTEEDMGDTGRLLVGMVVRTAELPSLTTLT